MASERLKSEENMHFNIETKTIRMHPRLLLTFIAGNIIPRILLLLCPPLNYYKHFIPTLLPHSKRKNKNNILMALYFEEDMEFNLRRIWRLKCLNSVCVEKDRNMIGGQQTSPHTNYQLSYQPCGSLPPPPSSSTHHLPPSTCLTPVKQPKTLTYNQNQN